MGGFFGETADELITKAELLMRTGRSETTFRRWDDAGIIFCTAASRTGKCILAAPTLKCIDFLSRADARKGSVSPARQKIDELTAEQMQIEVDQARGKLVDVDAVRAEREGICRRTLEALEAALDRVGKTPDERAMIVAELRRAMEVACG